MRSNPLCMVEASALLRAAICAFIAEMFYAVKWDYFGDAWMSKHNDAVFAADEIRASITGIGETNEDDDADSR